MIYQQVIYLANVLSIACSDGKITPDEDKILKSIASRIGADVNTVEQAKKLLIKGNYVLQPLKVTTDRVRNIEDMVMVAMADGKLGESEAAPIEQFTDMLGITQKEMDSIVARAQAKLQEDTEAIRYTKRRVARKAKTVSPPPPLPEVVPPPLPPLPVSTKVEQHVVEKKQKLHSLSKPSGHHQRKKQKKPEDRRPVSKDQYKPPADGLVITFSGSSSDVMTVALDALRSAPESGEHRTSSGKLYYGIWPDANLVKATGVALAIAGLLSRKVYVNGEEVSWDDLFAFTRCAVKRIASDNPVEYCFGCYDESLNIWGCRQAGMDWSETAEWFALGSFKDADGFIFDKNAISAMLEKRLRHVAICPFLSRACMSAALEKLPRTIKAKSGWRFSEVAGDATKSVLRTVTENVHGCLYSYEAQVNGMVPANEYEAIRLIRGAAKACGIKNLDIGRIRMNQRAGA